ncbi:MAG: MoxR family ATPase [Leptospiraceae bacterium]|nr:MoxR family ATPase [Leptospiraceae bacterium]
MAFKNLSEIQNIISSIKKEIHKGIVGQENLVDGLLIALIADGHLLIEGVPGLAKTRAVNLLSKICKVSFKRLQFTPDLLPADIVGTRIYNQSTAKFETSKGPIFANFVLADEINRAPAKVQSALLETMQERQVTIGEESFPVPRPFFVFATQNPVEQEGTYPLPEAQLDRFLMKLVVDYPTKDEETDVVKMIMNETRLPETNPVMDSANITDLQNFARNIYIDEKLIQYIVNIVFASRFPDIAGIDKNVIQYGASPRASIGLTIAARAKAMIDGRENVTPEDIKSISHNVLRHRIILTYHADAEGITTDQVITEILKKIKVP